MNLTKKGEKALQEEFCWNLYELMENEEYLNYLKNSLKQNQELLYDLIVSQESTPKEIKRQRNSIRKLYFGFALFGEAMALFLIWYFNTIVAINFPTTTFNNFLVYIADIILAVSFPSMILVDYNEKNIKAQVEEGFAPLIEGIRKK